MKKFKILSAATILLAATGCQQDDLFQQPTGHGDGSVGVNTNVVNSTRGFALNNVDDLIASGNGFDLFAFESDGNQFMGTQSDGIEFAYNNGWDYVNNGEVKFWQQVADGNTVDFYAVSPANTSGITMASDSQTINFTVNDISADQKDLMYAHSTPVDPDDTEVIDNGVHLDFYHALSQIVFKARTADEFIFAEVHGIEIVNLHNQGIFTLANAAFDNFTADVTPWQITSDDATASYTAEIAAPIAVNTNLNDEATENDEPAVITDSSTALLLLPQPVTGSFNEDKTVQPSDGGTYLRVNCVVKYQGTSDADETTIFSAEDGSAADLYIPVNSEWKAGYKYTYTIVFSRDVADPVTINEDLYVGPWYEDENGEDNTEEDEGEGEEEEEGPTDIEGIAYDSNAVTFSIASAKELLTIAQKVNDMETYEVNGETLYWRDANYVQTANIDLSEVCGEGLDNWIPIGYTDDNSGRDKTFQGTFDGQGFTISNLYYNGNDEYAGLFGYVHKGSLSNIHIVSGSVTSNYSHGKVGGIVGAINEYATIIGCSNAANVTATGSSTNVGGIAGFSLSPIIGSYNNGNITGGYDSGGIAGNSFQGGTCYACYNTGTVTGTENAGGIVGRGYQNLVACYNKGQVSNATNIGGIIGNLETNYSVGKFTACYYGGSCTATSPVGTGEIANGEGTNVPTEATTDWDAAISEMNEAAAEYGWEFVMDDEENITLNQTSTGNEGEDEYEEEY